MKKILVFILVVSLSTVSLYSQDNFDYSKFSGISLGIGGDITGDIMNGFLDFSFNLYQNNETGFFVRNHIEINGGGFGGGDFGVNTFGFRERISLGKIYAITDNFAVKSYGIIDFGFSFFNNSAVKNDIFTAPYMLESGIGGGVELLFTTPQSSKFNGSIFLEVGGRYRFFVGENRDVIRNSLSIADGAPFIKIGFRVYF